MYTRGRRFFLTALVAVFASLAVVHPSFSLSHELDHLEANELGHASGQGPTSDASEGERCDLCVSLSKARAAALSPGLLELAPASLVSYRETAQPPRFFIREVRGPSSPRAPPLH